MSWNCPQCGSSNGDGMARCYCGFERQPNGSDHARNERSGMTAVAEVAIFIGFNIIWVVLQLSNKAASPFRKGLAGALLVIYIIAGGILLWQHLDSLKRATPMLNPSRPTRQAATQPPPDVSPQANLNIDKPKASATFSLSNKSIESNGNFYAAIHLIEVANPDAIWQDAQDISISKVTKNPYSFLAKLCRVSGTVLTIKAIAPNNEYRGEWYEITMLKDDPSSIVGATTVSYTHLGNADNVNPGTNITCAGFFVGTMSGVNYVGEALVFLGNALKIASTTNTDHSKRKLPVFRGMLMPKAGNN